MKKALKIGWSNLMKHQRSQHGKDLKTDGACECLRKDGIQLIVVEQTGDFAAKSILMKHRKDNLANQRNR